MTVTIRGTENSESTLYLPHQTDPCGFRTRLIPTLRIFRDRKSATVASYTATSQALRGSNHVAPRVASSALVSRTVFSPKPYFNTFCFINPTDFTYGNEPRTDNTLRTPGTDDWDMSLFKDVPIHENMTLNFTVEAFNLFNRVQFGSPSTQPGNSQFGWITQQFNNP